MTNPTPTFGSNSTSNIVQRAQKDKKKPKSPHQAKLKLLSTCSGILFGVGTYWLIDPNSLPKWIEVVTVSVAGGVVIYAVNSAAITRGAYQAAAGVTGAAVASVGAILAAGLTISTGSFTGLTIHTVDQMVLQDFGRANSDYVQAYVSNVRQADEVMIAVDTALQQVSAAADCERVSSCVSRQGNGGEGLTFHTLNGVASQIDTVHQSLVAGEDVRDEALLALEDADANLQAALNNSYASRSARRAVVQDLLSEQRAALAGLERALPLSVVSGLAETLEAGIAIPNNPDLSQRINARLDPAGAGIIQALDGLGVAALERPAMPHETGVMETLAWVGFFLPLFAMLVLIDTLFPALLWFYTYSALVPTVSPKEDDDEGDDDPFDPGRVLNLPPVVLTPSTRPNPSAPAPKRRKLT